MKIRIMVIAFVLLMAVGVYSGFADGNLPGITSDDNYPNGCVSCHSAHDGNDYRLNVGMKEMSSHPTIDSMITNVPGDCAMCHSGDALSKVVHKVHYSNPSENHYVEYYGECLNCHTFDSSSGSMTVKSGKKNW